MEDEPLVISSIALVDGDKFLLELVEKDMLKKKSRSERWAARDSHYQDLGEEEQIPPFLLGRSMIPITLKISVAEFNRLQLRIGQEVTLLVVPVGA